MDMDKMKMLLSLQEQLPSFHFHGLFPHERFLHRAWVSLSYDPHILRQVSCELEKTALGNLNKLRTHPYLQYHTSFVVLYFVGICRCRLVTSVNNLKTWTIVIRLVPSSSLPSWMSQACQKILILLTPNQGFGDQVRCSLGCDPRDLQLSAWNVSTTIPGLGWWCVEHGRLISSKIHEYWYNLKKMLLINIFLFHLNVFFRCIHIMFQ